MSALTHFSLFSGIGGIDLAAEAAGFTTVCQCEWADFPMEVLKKHWPQVPKFRDITTVTKEAFFEKTGQETTTLISGGFPCQPFSSAGKQRGFEDERYLWPEMLRVIRELHPSWVLGENVAGFIHLGLDKTVFDLEQAGYAVRVFVLPAVAVGAWHERKRTFIIGHAASHAPCQRHGGCGENCRCADDPDRELPKIQSQRNRMDGAAVMGGLQTAGQPAGGCETESRLGGMADGIPPEMDGHSMWAKESAQIPYLISDPPANVAKRLKTLGNAVVPPQVYPILRYIAEIETGRCRNRQQGGDRIWNPLELFDALCSTDEVQRGKEYSDVFELAARKLGVAPEHCIVFDDVLPAIKSAKAARMLAGGIYDKYSADQRTEIERIADIYLLDFRQAPIPHKEV